MENANTEHQLKMQKRKELHDKKVRAANQEKKLLMVYTGTGKGKTTAAFGTVLRSLGHGKKVGIVQFIKGGGEFGQIGEQVALKAFGEQVRFEVMGEGFTWETQNRERDIEKARAAWETALTMLGDVSYHLVVLDELNIVLRYDYLPLAEVLEGLKNRQTHTIVTGRNSPQELMDAADLVSEIKMIKHPFREQGIKAQKGIEF